MIFYLIVCVLAIVGFVILVKLIKCTVKLVKWIITKEWIDSKEEKAKKQIEKQIEEQNDRQNIIIENDNFVNFLFFLTIIVFMTLTINTYITDIEPILDYINQVIEEKNETRQKNPSDIIGEYINWGELESVLTSDNKEITFRLVTTYFNGNLLYKITARPYDDRFQNSNLSHITVNIDKWYSKYLLFNQALPKKRQNLNNSDKFTLLSINIRSTEWQLERDDKGNSIGYVVNGKIQMAADDYNYLLEQKGRLNCNWDY